jgi:hypothetical protein
MPSLQSLPSSAQRLGVKPTGCGSMPTKEPAEGDACPKARSPPLAWDFGTSRWQLSAQTIPFSANREASAHCVCKGSSVFVVRVSLLLASETETSQSLPIRFAIEALAGSICTSSS